MEFGQGQAPKRLQTSLPYDVWVQGQYQSFREPADARNSDGFFGAVAGGADYIVHPGLLVGAYFVYDTMLQDSEVATFSLNGRGWMAGPYATLRLASNVYLSGRVAWGRTTNSVSPLLTFTDHFSTQRRLSSVTLNGIWQYDNWKVRPSATIAYVQDKSEAFSGGAGDIPGMKVSLGQFKAGPEISYLFWLPNGIALEPWIAPQLIWNFSSGDPVADLGGALSGREGIRERIDLGLRLITMHGVKLDASVGYDGLGTSNYSSVGGRARVNVPF